MIRTFFGSPGVGKTTLACKLAYKSRKLYKHAYLNFYNTVPGTGSCDLADLGLWTFPAYSYVGLDEASIEYNNRFFKTLPKHTIAYLKKLRHYKVDLDVFSQSWDDMDVTIRRLSTELWYMYRIGPWTLCRRVYKRVTVNKETEQIIDGYKMASMLWLLVFPVTLILQYLGVIQKKFMLTFRPFYYKYFNSWSTDNLPVRSFPIHGKKV